MHREGLKGFPQKNSFEIPTHLKLRLADGIHNFEWVKIILGFD